MSGVPSQALWVNASATKDDERPPCIPGIKPERLIASGGFGCVWLCEQQGTLVRKVAVKVLRSLLPSESARMRFSSEGRLLAQLSHPNIAQVFSAGEMSDGRPYLLMEMVDGQPLLEWCDARRLSLDDRLRIIQQAALAVHHAHARGIIHLDLKSANILVAEVDGHPLVKVIDFGVSRLFEGMDATGNGVTRESVGTVDAMAPEQCDDAAVLDTRADIYALGLVLYQLISGMSARDGVVLRSLSLGELRRCLEVRPLAPSVRLKQVQATAPLEIEACAQRRGVRVSQLIRRIDGQLDSIVMRCLETKVDDRYPTCHALSEDVRRFLSLEPVVASPPPTLTRIRLFARRNRIALTAGALTVAALAAGVILMALGLREARFQLARATRLYDFNTAMLTAVDPETAKGMDTRLMEVILAEAVAEIDRTFADDVELAADAHSVAGVAYRAIGKYDIALEHLRVHEQLLRAHHDAEHPRLLVARSELANALLLNGQVDEAAPLFEQVLEIRRRNFPDGHEHLLMSMHNLAWLRDEQGRPAEAADLYTDVVARKRAALGPEHPSTLRSLDNLGDVLRRTGKLDAAREVLAESVASRTRVFGSDAPDSLLAQNNLAVVLKSLGDLPASEAALRSVTEGMSRVLGADHPHTLIARNNLAGILRDTKRLEEAEAIYLDLLARFEAKSGIDAKSTLTVQGNLAMVLEMQHRPDEAEQVYLDNIARRRRALGDRSPSTLNALHNLAFLYADQMDRPQDAIRLWEESVSGLHSVHGEGNRQCASAAVSLARQYLKVGRAEDALKTARPYAEAAEGTIGLQMQLVALKTAGRAAEDLGLHSDAVRWLKRGRAVAEKLGNAEEVAAVDGMLAPYDRP
jgi:serine/threonine protein kinase/tetratricopeptide (TPR) repeat protein